MDLNCLHLMLAQAPAQGQPGAGDFLRSPLIPMIIMMGGLFYIMHRSNKKKSEEHAKLLKSLKPGDKILTSGGVIGAVVTVKEKTVTMRSADSKLELSKTAIAEITERGSGTGES